MARPRQATIVGVHATQQARSLPGRQSLELIAEAARGAIADAGLSPADIDGCALDWPGPGGAMDDPAANWAPCLQQPLAWTSNDPMDCAGVRGLLKAAAAIEAGLCDTVVLGSGRAGPWSTDGSVVGARMGLEFADPFGGFVMAHFALVATRYMHLHGVRVERFAEVAATIRNHGHANPEAAMYGAGPYSAADVLASPMIATPFTRLMCCLVNEGGCAMVLTTRERARDLPQPPVSVLGGGMEVLRGNYTAPPRYDEAIAMGRRAAARALGLAGVTAADLDVFSLYDPVVFEFIRQFEVLDLCGAGEGAEFCMTGGIGADGATPANLDGGTLSHSWTGSAQLTLKIIEIVRQLRHARGAQQVAGAETGLASNAGSGAHHIEMAVLGRT